ncbi:MAG: ABC transporter ATP-binding protein [Proteobacteria bacterium]|nr:ABC transporter ATP-binding protein [Pseudomonadota bacterium]
MLEIDNLSKCFGKIRAVDRLSLSLESDSVVGFLGPNGAGKTTTMRMVSGYLLPDSGSVRICGHDIVRQAQAAQMALGYLPEAPNGFGRLTVYEFLMFCGQARYLSGQTLKRAIDQTCERVELSPALSRPLSELSKGWRQRAWLAQAILHEPRVLVLDEPTDGLDPNQKELVRRLVRDLKEGRTIVLSTHILEEAEELCDRVVIINQGQLIADAALVSLVDGAGRLGARFRQLTTHNSESAVVA